MKAWNARFQDKINIVFVISADGNECQHVMVRLPDGSLYDGGYGVVTKKTLTMIMPGVWFDEMTEFDPDLLDKWSYGLARSYPNCP